MMPNYIEQVEKGGRKVKFKDLDLYMELWNTVRLMDLMPWYFDFELPLA
jgi:hypothetical protein